MNSRRVLASRRVAVAAVMLVSGVLTAQAGSAQVTPAQTTITTIAGTGASGYSGDGGPGTAATFYQPHQVAVGPDGSVYVSDDGNLRIRRIAPDGTITTVAGNGTRGFSGDGGPATEAQIDSVHGIAFGPDGSLYIADGGNLRVRRVAPDGTITTVAGSGERGVGGDGGPATEAELGGAYDVAVGPDGTLYLIDQTHDILRVVAPDGTISTLATGLDNPQGLALGADGSLYVASFGLNQILRVAPDGTVTAFAGNGTSGSSGDGGPATEATLEIVRDVAVGPDGSVYIADQAGRVRQVASDGTITTVAGNGSGGSSGDGGPATEAGITPFGIAVAPDGTFYFVESYNHRVRAVRLAEQIPEETTTTTTIEPTTTMPDASTTSAPTTVPDGSATTAPAPPTPSNPRPGQPSDTWSDAGRTLPRTGSLVFPMIAGGLVLLLAGSGLLLAARRRRPGTAL